MDPITQQTLLGAAGAAGGDKVYVDDVFSTFVYSGTGNPRTITNGIDLAGEGGLVWTKGREPNGFFHALADTENGVGGYLFSNTTGGWYSNSTSITAFNSDGYSIGTSTDGNLNATTSNAKFVSWTFRKQKGFFDIVTWSGNDTARAIPHNLGSVPGMIIVKKTSDSGGWYVYHRSMGNGKWVDLSSTNDASTVNFWNNQSPTASNFYLSTNTNVNGSGHSFIAYVFAHDEASFGTDGDESIIKCGSYTGTSAGGRATIDVGFEPQWVLIKGADSNNTNWLILDNMRGAGDDSQDQPYLSANNSNAESTQTGLRIFITSNGFGWRDQGGSTPIDINGDEYIYMAIRRPHKPLDAFDPSLDATDVFFPTAQSSSSNTFSVGFPLDMALSTRNSGSSRYVVSRLTGSKKALEANTNTTPATYNASLDLQDSFSLNGWLGNAPTISLCFRRAPGFFDMVLYEGTGSAQTIAHKLYATPSVVLIKGNDSSFHWFWQHYALGANTYLELDTNAIKSSNGNLFNNTLPTSSVFSVGNNPSEDGTNVTNNLYVAYLFGDLPGVSKAGTYTGTGNTINVDCGFTNGARLVIIKRTDNQTGSWYVWNSSSGIVSGNDPYFNIDTTSAETTNTDYIDPLNAGFTVTSSAPAALNTSGGTYLFLAIA